RRGEETPPGEDQRVFRAGPATSQAARRRRQLRRGRPASRGSEGPDRGPEDDGTGATGRRHEAAPRRLTEPAFWRTRLRTSQGDSSMSTSLTRRQLLQAAAVAGLAPAS